MSSTYQSDATGHHTTMQQYQPVCGAEERKTLASKYGNMRFSLQVVQQPKQSRMSGVGEKNNRRPIDPPPACVLQINERPINFPEMESMSLFVQVVLLNADTLEPATVSNKERQTMTALVGVTNTTLHRISAPIDPERNPNGTPIQQGVFAFTDLSIRQEGQYKLQFNCYEIIDGEAIHRCKVESDRLRVYPAKGFPGMKESTPFTDILKKHGIRVRVSKSIRTSRKLGNKVANNPRYEPEENVQRVSGSRPYDLDAPRDRHDRHRREVKYDGYETNTYTPATTQPILPPPLNTSFSPSPVTPSYDRSFDHSYNTHSYHQSTLPSYNERRDTGPERRHTDYNHRPRAYEPYAKPIPAYTNNPLPVPFSPPPRQYSPNTITPSNPYVNAAPRRTSAPFSPGPRTRPADFNSSRRFSITQANSLPPLQYHTTDPPRNHPDPNSMQDIRHGSHDVKQPNGMDFMGEQFQPPPPHVPLAEPQNWGPYYTSGTGYQGVNEGYRG